MISQGLTLELLEHLRAALAKQRGPIVDRLRPGITDAEIDALLAPLGLRAPSELRLWWNWHDGTDPGRYGYGPEEGIGPLHCYLPCHKAVSFYVDGREQVRVGLSPIAAEQDEEEVGEWWPESWLPFSVGGATYCVDCSNPAAATATIHLVSRHEPYPEPVAGSLGQLVCWWITALEVGAWEYVRDADGSCWTQDVSRLPPEIRASPAMT